MNGYIYVGFCVGVVLVAGAVVHVVKVVRKVRTLISQAADEDPTDPVDAPLDADDIAALIKATSEEEEQIHFALWEQQLGSKR